jgi:hypothetical protein
MALARIGVLAGRQNTQHHGAQQPRRLLALARHHAGNVALGDMAELVRQHRRQFIAAAHHPHQPQMQAKVGTGQGKGIDRAVAAQQNLPGVGLVELRGQLAALAGRRQQRLPDALHVFHEDRIVHIVRVAVQLAGNAVAQARVRRWGSCRCRRPGRARAAAVAVPRTRTPPVATVPSVTRMRTAIKTDS